MLYCHGYILSYFKKSINKHTINLKLRVFEIVILTMCTIAAFLCRDAVRNVSQLILLTTSFSPLFHLGCCVVPAAQ